jgi:hypothetical protein
MAYTPELSQYHSATLPPAQPAGIKPDAAVAPSTEDDLAPFNAIKRLREYVT